ncbi:MAG: hypothetical protein WKF78_10625 [Candidatus Limnocylindrales bacterium]
MGGHAHGRCRQDRRRWPGTIALADAKLSLFHPLKFMLASPAEDAAEILRRLGPTVWLEDKYDGIRAQLHKGRQRTCGSTRATSTTSAASSPRSWRRRGRRSTGMAVLDGEILAFGTTTWSCPSSALQARLGRKSPSDAIRAEVPVIYVAFDLAGPGRGRRWRRRP